jgi:hypothetical protein
VGTIEHVGEGQGLGNQPPVQLGRWKVSGKTLDWFSVLPRV